MLIWCYVACGVLNVYCDYVVVGCAMYDDVIWLMFCAWLCCLMWKCVMVLGYAWILYYIVGVGW